MGHITWLIDGLPQNANVNEEVINALQAFSTYLRTFWVPLAENISVFEKPVRTNHTCENFHLCAGRRLGYRSNIFKFLGKFYIFLCFFMPFRALKSS